VDSSFFHLMGWRPREGRLFTEADDRTGAAAVALVTSEFAEKMLSGDPRSIGAALALDGTAYQIVGILPCGLKFFTEPVAVYLPADPRNGTPINTDRHVRDVLIEG